MTKRDRELVIEALATLERLVVSIEPVEGAEDDLKAEGIDVLANAYATIFRIKQHLENVK